MIRRHFLKFTILAGLGLMAMMTFNSSYVRKAFYRIKYMFTDPPPTIPESERSEATLPIQGPAVSIETALNSRCTSDDDDNPKFFHWGMFDQGKKLTKEQIEKVIALARIPRFTDKTTRISHEGSILTFVVDGGQKGFIHDSLMIESGMQHQATGLICAALGVGYVFRNLGVDGTLMAGGELGTVKFRLDPIKPSYGGSFWTNDPPEDPPDGRNILPNPSRRGTKPLLSALQELKTEVGDGKKTTLENLSQLLWAARGRTPHYYKSVPYGLTIPTWGGEQGISEVHVIKDRKLATYVNLRKNRWTHALDPVSDLNDDLNRKLLESFSPFNCFIVLARIDMHTRSLWEVGYQLFNLMLQAYSLGLSYKAVPLDVKKKEIFIATGIKNPAALFLLQY